MTGILDWVCDLLVSRGALAEREEGGPVRALLPAAVAAALGSPEWLALDASIDDAQWLDRMERLLPAQPLLVEALYRGAGPPAPIDAAAVLSSGFAIQNGIWRLAGEATTAADYLLFTFQYTIESDDRAAGVPTVCLNTSAGGLAALPENFLLGIRDGLRETSGISGAELARRWQPAAVQAVRPTVQKHVARVAEIANRRLARDIERVESYYAGLLAQIEKRAAKRAGDAAAVEKERGRAAATEADRAAKIEDVRRKYALRVRIEPALVLAVRAPVRRISVRLIRKKEERAFCVDWNPVLGVLDSTLCEHCRGEARPLFLCERVHVLCKDCWTQCPGCARFHCRACQPRCKCEAEGGSRTS